MADIRPYPFFGTGAPTNGGSGTLANVKGNGKGAHYVDVATGNEYVNTNTKASPTWAVASSAEEASFLLAIPTTAVADVAAADVVGAVGANPTQAEYATMVTLANELKSKLNLALARLRTAGILTP